MQIEPVTLEGKLVKLVPLTEAHTQLLFELAQEKRIWEHYPTKSRTYPDVEQIVQEALAQQKLQRELPFAIIDKASDTLAGSTRFMDISLPHRTLEIGWTWLTSRLWGTGANLECKLILLTHAFEKLGAIRVYLKTDERNQRSRKAIEKIGATFEGVLRNHMIRDDGTYRNSALYSIIESEWPMVKEELEAKLVRTTTAQI